MCFVAAFGAALIWLAIGVNQDHAILAGPPANAHHKARHLAFS
jgi:hypothetical protein